MKLFCTIWMLVFCICDISAQWKSSDYFKEIYKQQDKILSVAVDNHFASNTIVSSFAWNYLRGNYISESEKDDCISNFNNEQIRVGERFKTGISIYKKLGKVPIFLVWNIQRMFFMKRVYTMIYLVCYLKEIKALRANRLL